GRPRHQYFRNAGWPAHGPRRRFDHDPDTRRSGLGRAPRRDPADTGHRRNAGGHAIARTLILVRHAESQWNEQAIYQGQRDESDLPDLGTRRAEALREPLLARPIAAIYASPLRRSIRTAEIVAGDRQLDVVLDRDLLEIDHGEWSGLEHQAVRQRW